MSMHGCANTIVVNDNTYPPPVWVKVFDVGVEFFVDCWISLFPYSLFGNRKIGIIEEWNILDSEILILLILKNQNKNIMYWIYSHLGYLVRIMREHWYY